MDTNRIYSGGPPIYGCRSCYVGSAQKHVNYKKDHDCPRYRTAQRWFSRKFEFPLPSCEIGGCSDLWNMLSSSSSCTSLVHRHLITNDVRGPVCLPLPVCLHQTFRLASLQAHMDRGTFPLLVGCECLPVPGVAAHISCTQVSYMTVSTSLRLGSLSRSGVALEGGTA